MNTQPLDNRVKDSDSYKYQVDKLDLANFNVNNIPLDDPATWAKFGRGETKGVFQLETPLGKQWSAKLQPENIEELAALVSILRPGPLMSRMSQSFVDRKHGREEISVIHPSLEDILGPTYQTLIYQEQVLQIATKIAGFDGPKSDDLRKAVGHKLPEEMVKVKKEFLEGCKKVAIVSEEQAAEIFGWIEKSVRYAFNKCLGLSTTVETTSGLKTLRHLKVGDYVLTTDDIDLYHEKIVKVVKIIDTGLQDLIELSFPFGINIECTKDHKHVIENGNKLTYTQAIKHRQRIMCRYHKNGEWYIKPLPITGVKWIGLQPSIDIEVNNIEHRYFANGVLTSNCVTGDTTVETEHGYKCIGELSTGESIKAPSDDLKSDRFVKVKDIIDTGTQDVYEVILSSDKQIKCTLEHKFLCQDGKTHELYEILTENLEIMCED